MTGHFRRNISGPIRFINEKLKLAFIANHRSLGMQSVAEGVWTHDRFIGRCFHLCVSNWQGTACFSFWLWLTSANVCPILAQSFLFRRNLLWIRIVWSTSTIGFSLRSIQLWFIQSTIGTSLFDLGCIFCLPIFRVLSIVCIEIVFRHLHHCFQRWPLVSGLLITCTGFSLLFVVIIAVPHHISSSAMNYLECISPINDGFGVEGTVACGIDFSRYALGL